MRILTRYVLAELLKVFLISLTGLTMMFVIVVVIREAANQSLPLAQVLQLIPYAPARVAAHDGAGHVFVGLHQRCMRGCRGPMKWWPPRPWAFRPWS